MAPNQPRQAVKPPRPKRRPREKRLGHEFGHEKTKTARHVVAGRVDVQKKPK